MIDQVSGKDAFEVFVIRMGDVSSSVCCCFCQFLQVLDWMTQRTGSVNSLFQSGPFTYCYAPEAAASQCWTPVLIPFMRPCGRHWHN